MTDNLGTERKAFLFQQAHELGVWVQELGTLSVVVDQTEEHPVYGVTFVIAPESLKIKARGEHEDFYTACRLAKEDAISKANMVLSQATPTAERQGAIQAIVDRRLLH